jgi:hypothetical protein
MDLWSYVRFGGPIEPCQYPRVSFWNSGLEDTMRKIAAGVIGFLALCAVPLLAQGASNETLSALLVEVRLLRQALERSASAPQVQLLGTRLTVQNARLQTAIHDHEIARSELQQVATSILEATARLEELADAVGQNQIPTRRTELEQAQAATKYELANLNRREPPLRARESELAAAVAAEQDQWLLLNRRLDEIERGLPR